MRINNGQIALSATNRIVGRVTAGAGASEELTGTQATTLLDNFTSALKGLVPASGGGTTNFLRADGTWAAPSGGGGVADGDKGDITVGSTGTVWTIDPNAVTYAKMQDVSATNRIMGRITAAAGDMEELTGTQATTLLDTFTSALKGLVPASGGGTANFLRADGTWAAPADNDPLLLSTETTADAPAGGNPSTGVKLFGAVRANRRIPAWLSPTGKTERVQAFLGSNDTKIVDATGTGPTASSTVGYTVSGANMAADVGATFALPAIAITNYLTMQPRKTLAVGATVNLMMESKPTAAWCSRRSVGGGFHFSIRFGLETVLPGTGRLFVGFTNATTALTNADQLGTLTHSIGLYKNTADTTLKLMLSNTPANQNQTITLTNTGAVGWNTAGTMFQLEFFCKAGDTGFGYRVTRWDATTGATAIDEGYVNSGNMPAIDTLFVPHLWACNVAATATTIAFVQMYCETD